MARSQKQPSLAPTSVPQVMPILPLRNAVFFPHQVTPLSVGRESSVKVVEEATNEESLLVIVAQTDPDVEKPTERDIQWVGTLAKVLKVFTMADGTRSVLMQGIRRVQLISILQSEPYLRAVVREIPEASGKGIEIDAMAANLKSLFKKAVELSPNLSEEQLTVVLNMESTEAVADMVASMIPVSVQEKQEILEAAELKKRLESVTLALTKLVQKLELGSKIQSEVQDGINKSQREYYLREQMKAIKKELGEDEDSVEL